MDRRLFLFSGLACAQVAHQPHHKHGMTDTFLKVLDDPSRDAWQKPHEVVTALALRPDEVIADIGAGTGYFAKRFARHAGRVLAVDIDQRLLDRCRDGAPDHLVAVLATPADPKLEPASIDTAFFCDVVHHIDARPAYYAKIRTALRPKGRGVVIDFHERPLPVGPPPAMKISRQQMIDEWKAAGFALHREHGILPHQYFLEFKLA